MTSLNFTGKDLINFFLNPRGSMTRLPFFIGCIFLDIFMLVFIKLFRNLSSEETLTAIVLLPILGMVLVVCSYFILCIKRLRDLKKPPAICFLNLIPGLNIGMFFYLVLKKGYN